MTTTARHQARDQLMAQVRLTKQRVEELNGRIDELDDDDRAVLADQSKALTARCEDLSVEIGSWQEVEVGVPTSVEDLESAVDTLEADLEALAPAGPGGVGPVLDRQVKAWKQRVDWLRLQGALGGMQARDELDEMSRRLGRVRGDVLVEVHNAIDDSKDVVVDLRSDVQEVLVDVRRAVEKAAADLTSR